MSKTSFIINSSDRENKTNNSVVEFSDFYIKLPIPVPNQFRDIHVSQISIPKTYLLFDGINSIFTLSENGGSPIDIVLPAGNYNIFSLAIVLQALLNDASPNGWAYTMTYPDKYREQDTKKWTWSVLGPNVTLGDTISFNLPAGVNIVTALGLLEGVNNFEVGVTAIAPYTLTSNYEINLQPTQYIKIHTDMCNNPESNATETDIIHIVDATQVDDGDYIFDNVNGVIKKFNNNNTNLFHFTLRDDKDNILILNGNSEWFIEIVLS